MTANKLMDLIGQYEGAAKARTEAFAKPDQPLAPLLTTHAAQQQAAEALADFLLSRKAELAGIFSRAAAHEEGHGRLADLWTLAEEASEGDYYGYASAAEDLSVSLDQTGAQLFAQLFQALADAA